MDHIRSRVKQAVSELCEISASIDEIAERLAALRRRQLDIAAQIVNANVVDYNPREVDVLFAALVCISAPASWKQLVAGLVGQVTITQSNGHSATMVTLRHIADCGLAYASASEIMAVINAQIDERIGQTRRRYAESTEQDCDQLHDIKQFVHTVCIPLLRDTLFATQSPPRSMAAWLDSLEESTISKCVSMQCSEIYDIINSYPASHQYLDSLRLLFTGPARRRQLLIAVREQVSRRLLNQGNSTKAILTFFVQSIKALRYIDPTGLVAEEGVAAPIRAYLRNPSSLATNNDANVVYGGRRDLASSVVSCLIGEHGDLLEELRHATVTAIDERALKAARRGKLSAISVSSASSSAAAAAALSSSMLFGSMAMSLEGGYESDDDDPPYSDVDWMPCTVDARAVPQTALQWSRDILASLVGLFDNLQVLMDAIRHAITDQMMTVLNNDAAIVLVPKGESQLRPLPLEFPLDNLQRTVELLLLRFGQQRMQQCSVMLNDMLNAHISDNSTRNLQPLISMEQVTPVAHSKRSRPSQQKNSLAESSLYVLTTSGSYWPDPHKLGPLKLPKEITKKMKQYSRQYSQYKSKRYLEWIPHSGSVVLDLQFMDGADSIKVLSIQCTPAQATVISCFSSNDVSGGITLGIDELLEKTQLKENLLRGCIAFWVSKGVLTLTDGSSSSDDDEIYSSSGRWNDTLQQTYDKIQRYIQRQTQLLEQQPPSLTRSSTSTSNTASTLGIAPSRNSQSPWLSTSLSSSEDRNSGDGASGNDDEPEYLDTGVVSSAAGHGSSARGTADEQNEADEEDEDDLQSLLKPPSQPPEITVYWPFIQSLMTNLGSMTAERLQQMLTLFVQQPMRYTRKIDELRVYLSVLVDDGKLQQSDDGSYKLSS
ncbi:hypothetical protein GQ42DRAFT_64227 [Ramicandelaber brevisporus]|nr:hypothetical protein GQ42DRAFT_64227 [Ramicandelaber brevisporus]